MAIRKSSDNTLSKFNTNAEIVTPSIEYLNQKILTNQNQINYALANNRNFKNRIINGDFSVAQRGESHSIYNTGKYTIDRVFATTLGYYLSHQRNKIYAPDEGNLANTLDIFGDGSCIACYTFDGNANDLSGNYNGTWNGNEQYDIGRFGQAAKFDGSSYIKIPEPLTSLPFSISLWVNTNQIAHNNNGADWANPTLIGFATPNANSNDFGVEVKDGFIHIFSGFGVEKYYTTSMFISDSVWHLICVIFEQNFCRIYCDDKFISSFSQNSTSISPVSDWTIGALYNYDGSFIEPYSYFDGLIDQVRIFNRPLTEDEVKILYTESNNYKESPTYFLISRVDNEDTTTTTKWIIPYMYRFEGHHLYDLAIQGKKVTLSFEFASNKNGTYSLAFRNCTNGIYDSYVKSFEYTGNGEFQKFSFTFDLSEFPKRFKSDENRGFELIICSNSPGHDAPNEGLHTGVDYHFLTGTNAFTTQDWFKIRNVQLEEGDIATEFEYVPYDIQLLRCMRYCWIFDRTRDGSSYYFQKYVDSNQLYFADVSLPVPMRTLPTVQKCIISSDITNIQLATSVKPFYVSTKQVVVFGQSSDGNPVTISANIYYIEIDAEL